MSNLVVQSNLLPTPAEFQTLKEIASMSVKSGLLPSSIKTPEQAIIIALKGRELGIPPMVAFSQISVINGKPCISAELMLSQIHQKVPSASINFIKNDNESCVIEAVRKNCKPSTWSFTIEDAKNANLLGKQVWKQFPAAMLRARAISAMARAVFPDALNGASYTPEEMGAEVEIDDQGSEIVKDITPRQGQDEIKPITQGAPVEATKQIEKPVAGESKQAVMTSQSQVNNTEAVEQKPMQQVLAPRPPNLAPQTRLDAYKTTFSFGTFPPGKTFQQLGVKDTTNLLNAIKAWKLKKESEGGNIPSLCEEFIGLAEEWLEREKA